MPDATSLHLFRLMASYYTMAAMVVAGKVRSLKSLGTEIKIAR